MANNFLGDAVALWRFEDGALTVDSVGGNTLIAVNTPVSDTENFLEGGASVDLERDSSQYLYIADANLDVGFPLKNGDTVKLISVFCRFKIESIANSWIFSKTSSNTAQRGWGIYLKSTGKLEYWCGYSSGGASQEVSTGYTLKVGRWYSLGVACDGINKTILGRLYDHTTETVVYSDTVSFDYELNVEAANVCIGCKADPAEYWDGLIDEIAVFNRLIDATEIDFMINGTFNLTSVFVATNLNWQSVGEMKINVGGDLKSVHEGWVVVDGNWKPFWPPT